MNERKNESANERANEKSDEDEDDDGEEEEDCLNVPFWQKPFAFSYSVVRMYILCGTSTSTCRFIFIALVRSFALYLQKGPLLLNVYDVAVVVVAAAAVDDDDDVDDDEKGKCTLKTAANFMYMLFIVMLGWISINFAKTAFFRFISHLVQLKILSSCVPSISLNSDSALAASERRIRNIPMIF